MKKRNVPYGYMYDNGIVVECPKEAEMLRMICQAYTVGQSLNKISQWLNKESVEYMPGVLGWNKARLMRIIEDDRYIGTESFPALIDSDTHRQMLLLRSERNTQKNVDRTADIFTLDTPVICPKCGAEMNRRHDSRCRCHQRWICKNEKCHEMIAVSDEELLSQIKSILNSIIKNPAIIIAPSTLSMSENAQVIRSQNEISRTLNTVGYDKSALRKKMQDCLAMKYRSIDHHGYAIQQMKSEFEDASPLSEYSADLVNRTVKSIALCEDGTVFLTLINDQTIGKEMNWNGNARSCPA